MKWHQPILGQKVLEIFTSADFFTALLESVQSLIDCKSK